MKKAIIFIVLSCLACCLFAQVNGSLQQLGDKKILYVWGDHFQRGKAQGYFLAPQIMDVFNTLFWTMFCFSSQSYYSYITTFYSDHFAPAPELVAELNGMLSGMEQAGISLYHQGLNRDLGIDDLLLLNAMYDLVEVQENLPAPRNLQLGCASLSSWGSATAADSLLAGSAVITRFLDISQNSALIAAPLLVVHLPAEADEQNWLNITIPGFVGALTAINSSGVYASMNTATDSYPVNPVLTIDPILFDLRRGVEKADYDENGVASPMDVFASLSAGNHLSEFIVHTLQETPSGTYSSVIETKYGNTVYRTVGQFSGLPGDNLAATNHFRRLASPACCNRYYQIQDSLYANPQVSAKRQWNLMSGAAGLETNLSAVQYTPSTGLLLWAAATSSQPAYSQPALALSLSDLLSYPVSNDDEVNVPLLPQISLFPNPLGRTDDLTVKSSNHPSEIRIYNLKGQLVYQHSNPGRADAVQLQLSRLHLAAGVYLVETQFSRQVIRSSKFVVY